MFTKLPSFQKLHYLANSSPYLPELLDPDRIQNMVVEKVGFQLFYGTERVSDEILSCLFDLAAESGALDKMRQMQEGDLLNRIEGFESENRSVLHTAMRDQFGSTQKTHLAKEAARLAALELDKLEKFLIHVEGKYTDLIQIGIGGSDLGPRALCMALEPFHKQGLKAHFISNVDPDDASTVLSQVNLKKTLVVVVSKSGNTLETLTNEMFVREHMKQQGLNPQNHFVAVTGEKSPMDDPASYLESFYIWDFVGGRYSATSMVGGVLLGFMMGFDRFKELLKGAHEMDLHAIKEPAHSNLPLLSALLGIWNRNFLNLPTVAIIPYSQALLRFPAHLQQLDMESNGKRIDKQGRTCSFPTGPVIWGEPGTNGQHSFYQLIHQGTDIIPVEFIGFTNSQHPRDLIIQQTTSQQKLLSNLFAQSIALAVGKRDENPNKVFPGNRPNRILFGKRLDPFTIGSLLAYYEHKVAFQGFIWNINSFDQEGVQLGKVLANKMLTLFSAPQTKDPFLLGKAYLEKTSLL